MNVIGIICEYNPFHNGHKYQIDKIKELYKDSIIIACMSTCFTQRGDISILNKFDKTKVALSNGIDIVIELPYVFTTQSADIFAKHSIKILNEVKIDTLVFGTENDKVCDLEKSAYTQTNNKEYDNLVKKYMDEGNNYPTSLNLAIKNLNSISIKTPNDLLALSYIKEIIKNKYNIKYVNIKRTNDFHDVTNNSNIVSASNIRNSILNNKDFSHQVPKTVYEILKNKTINYDKYFELLKYKIICEDDLSIYNDVDEGIDKRIKNVIYKSNNIDELIKNIKTKRYTYNKISRILNHILCSYNKNNNYDLDYIRILGFNNKGKQYLNSIKKEMNIKILNSFDINSETLKMEKRITDIYSMIQDDIRDTNKCNKPIYIDD